MAEALLDTVLGKLADKENELLLTGSSRLTQVKGPWSTRSTSRYSTAQLRSVRKQHKKAYFVTCADTMLP